MTPSKKATKKRTQYQAKGILELPDWAKQDTTHKYRWVRKSSYRSSRTDGYDPRGWVVARDSEGQSLEALDTILTKMPIDEWDSMKDHKDAEARNLIKDVAAAIEDRDSRVRYEIEKLGGKIDNTTFSVEKRN